MSGPVPRETPPPGRADAPSLEARGLAKHFGPQLALAGVDLTVRTGDGYYTQ